MKVVTKPELLVLVPESADETAALGEWKAGRDGYVLGLLQNAGAGATLRFLGPRPEVCREPINVTSRNPDPQIRLIGNLAATPFELDGQRYASVEGFWQSLKFDADADRRRVAALSGSEAKRAGSEVEYGATVTHQGEAVPVGTWAHWQLMRKACAAKFEQDFEARSALIGTGERPLIHKVRHDSKTIPGAVMADIWMRIRARYAKAAELAAEADAKSEEA